MSGFIVMNRAALNHPILKDGDKFRAWFWLVANAAWKPSKVRIKGKTVEIGRGELSFSCRFLAENWGWSKSRVDRFIADLREDGMIETRSKIGTTAGHSAGQGQSIITICNYDKYQSPNESQRDNDDAECGTTAGQQRDKEEQGNKEKKEDNISGYAFSGSVIRLKHGDFQRWQKAFPDLDLTSLLTSRDDWLSDRPPTEQRRWFQSTSSWLANRQQDARKKSLIDPMENFLV